MKSDNEKAFISWYIDNNNIKTDSYRSVKEAIYAAESLLNYNYYICLTESEADETAKNYILETVWAFKKSFLDAHSSAISKTSEKAFTAIQDLCEGANELILNSIDNVEDFVQDAISTDGRGHFISVYDSTENESVYNGTMYYIYRLS